MPLQIVKSKAHVTERSLGFFILAVIEHFLVHGPGDIIGEPARLVPETQRFIVDAYALDANGRRLYDSAFFSRPKGFAKSEMAAFIAIVEACFPCRFDHYAEEGETYEFLDFTYEFEAGEPVPRYVASPFVRLVATEEDQILKGVFGVIYYNLSAGNSPLAEAFSPSDVLQSKIKIPWTDGEIVPSTSAGSSKDGGKETFVVFDETHLYDSQSLKNTYSIIKNNLKKKKAAEPWALETSTMFEPSAESVAESTYNAAMIIDEDERVASDYMRLYFNHRQGPEDIDFDDFDEVHSAVIEAYGDFAEFMDTRRIAGDFFSTQHTQANQRRFFLNQITPDDDSWIHPSAWKQCELAADDYMTDPLVPGDEIAMAFDGSEGRKANEDAKNTADSTALVGVRLRDGLVFTLGVWEQPEGKAGLGWKPPRDEVIERIEEVFEEFTVRAFYADPSYWESEIAKLEAKFGKRLKARAHRERPIAWSFSDSARVSRAIDVTQQAIQQKELKHHDQKTLGKHVRNARAVKKRYGVALYKPVGHNERKIDLAVCLVMAWQARLDALSRVKTDTGGSRRKYLSPPRVVNRSTRRAMI